MFRGDLLRASPFDPDRLFSDDSELCERWKRDFDATFAISDAYVYEQGKVSFHELWVRCRMYGTSDAEVFTSGRTNGWPVSRQIRSLAHPLAADVIEPMTHTRATQAAGALPFLLAFASMRYAGWAQAAWKRQARAA